MKMKSMTRIALISSALALPAIIESAAEHGRGKGPGRGRALRANTVAEFKGETSIQRVIIARGG